MIYSSLLFIYFFLPVSLIIYYLTPQKLKEMTMLLLSMVFAASFGLKYLFFLMVFTTVNYTAARVMAALSNKTEQLRPVPLALGLIFDFSALFSFRTELFAFLREPLALPETFFPAGISLFTLSAAGYLIDVYKGKIRAERNFVRFSLFIMMFPRLIMGPVLTYDSFIRITKSKRINMSRLGTGLSVFITGLAKKVLAADHLYVMYDAIRSSDHSQLSAVSAWMGMTAYVLCLYFTLSGMADMGLGIGCCFGYRFPYSFNYPLFSWKIRYFSAKWHMQVIHWFRRYIIQPLSDLTSSRRFSELIFIGSWALVGIWYGFSLSAAVWGVLMGTAITIERKIRSSRMLKSTGIICTFAATTIIAVFLAENTVSGAMNYLYAMIGGNSLLADQLTSYLFSSYIVIVLIAMYAATDLFRNTTARIGKTAFRKAAAVSTPVILTLLLALCTALMIFSGSSEMQIIRL